MNIRSELAQRIGRAISSIASEPCDAIVNVSSRPQFGDYQANGCMAAAKRAKTNPRAFAEKVLAMLDLSDIVESLEIAGPGFINITLRRDFLEAQLIAMASSDTLGCEPDGEAQTVVVDFSSPNLAKEMHVGHLRSTIIGDALARVLEFLGHSVIRQNHVGDWGTQFGMLLNYMNETGSETTTLANLEEFYRASKQRFDEDETFATTSREMVVKLQSGDTKCKAAWQQFLDISLGHCQTAYDRLGVKLTRDDVRGESAYNADLPVVVSDLDATGLLKESDGARGVYLDEYRNKDDEPLFIIVQKSDGGYLYATTDLAAMRYRTRELHADRILYVTDSRQGDHFAQVFLIAQRAGFVGESISLEHVPFGMMLGDDGRPFKTRSGGTVKLMDLLDEAATRAGNLVAEKNPDLSDEAREEISRVVGIGALKYADLSQNRTSDYVFAWDKMISLDGNTAPYMQYAYARIRSIFRKAGDNAATGAIRLGEPQERALAAKLLQFAEAVDSVSRSAMPNILCSYLFELAGAYMSFYESCPVLKEDVAPETRASRLALCELAARTIQTGLGLLGIETLEQM